MTGTFPDEKSSDTELFKTIATLSELFPGVFVEHPWQQHRPLAIGTADRLVALGILSIDESKIALRRYTRRLMYQKSLAAGGPRYALDGTVDGEVAAEQSAHAAAQVANIEKSRIKHALAAKEDVKAKRAAAKSPAPPPRRTMSTLKSSERPSPPPAPQSSRGDGLAALRAAALARKQENVTGNER